MTAYSDDEDGFDMTDNESDGDEFIPTPRHEYDNNGFEGDSDSSSESESVNHLDQLVNQVAEGEVADIVASSSSSSRPSSSSSQPRSRGRPKKSSANQSRTLTLPDSDTQPVTYQQVAGVETMNNFRFTPPHEPGVLAPLSETSSPIDCFMTLLPEELLEELRGNINDYAKLKCQLNNPPRKRSVYKDWRDVTLTEMYRYLSILVAMGMDNKPRFRDYWSTKPHMKCEWFNDMLVRDRFEAIHYTMLHCSETEADGKAKVEPFINDLVENFQKSFYPFQEVSIDEMVIGWKGRFKYKMYNPQKPSKYHVKTFGLCDSSTGYVVNLLIYFGKDTSYGPHIDPDSESAIKVFSTLLKPLSKGHHIYADRYYTTYNLVRYLLREHQYYTGTVQVNRKNFPPEHKTLKLNKQESRFYRSDDGSVLTVAWRDKKAKKNCLAVSTKASTEIIAQTNKRNEPVSKPALIDNYNSAMGGCDLMDQMISYGGVFQRKTRKWWKKIFHWIIEITLVNSYILYKLTRAEGQKPLPLQGYKDILINQLKQRALLVLDPNDPVKTPKRGRPSLDMNSRFEGNKHLIKYVKEDRRCVVCSKPPQKKRSNYVCTGCPEQPHLHPKDCFLAFHTPGRAGASGDN